MWAFGRKYKEKNLFQAYYLGMVKAIEEDDLEYFYQLKEELLETENGTDRFIYVWNHIASDTRAKVPKGV